MTRGFWDWGVAEQCIHSALLGLKNLIDLTTTPIQKNDGVTSAKACPHSHMV